MALATVNGNTVEVSGKGSIEVVKGNIEKVEEKTVGPMELISITVKGEDGKLYGIVIEKEGEELFLQLVGPQGEMRNLVREEKEVCLEGVCVKINF